MDTLATGFRVFRVFRGFEITIRAPSCPFVVLKILFVPLRVHSWFNPFLPLRGSSSTPSSVFVFFVCFVVLKILFVPLRVH